MSWCHAWSLYDTNFIPVFISLIRCRLNIWAMIKFDDFLILIKRGEELKRKRVAEKLILKFPVGYFAWSGWSVSRYQVSNKVGSSIALTHTLEVFHLILSYQLISVLFEFYFYLFSFFRWTVISCVSFTVKNNSLNYQTQNCWSNRLISLETYPRPYLLPNTVSHNCCRSVII